MKIIYCAIIAISLFVLNVSHASASEREPVMIIRFNQELVNYERSLEKVIKSALSLKDSAFFDVVSVVPETESKKHNKQITKHSTFLTNQVIDNLQLSGIAAQNIRVTYQNSSVIDDNEVHIFVR